MTSNTHIHSCEDHDHEEMVSFEHIDEDMDEEMLEDMASTFLEAFHHQTQLALELTKLVVEKSAAPMDEKAIFAVFEKASNVISEKSPLKNLIEKVSHL